MDVVIPFVDCSDSLWVKNFFKLGNSSLIDSENRYVYFYDYGTIKYALRGIDMFMPYVENVFLVVSSITQVPDYIDQSKVKIVLHSDFIPEEYLPTYQPNTIELFINKIPGIGEEFVYFNDDMIPVSPISYTDLFKNGLPCIKFEVNNRPNHTLSSIVCNHSFYEAKSSVEKYTETKIDYDGEVLIPVHGPTALIKSVCDTMSSLDRHNDLLNFYTSTYRRARNINQYYWACILYFLNKYESSNLNLKYIKTSDIDSLDLNDICTNYNYVCINDAGIKNCSYSELENKIDNFFIQIFPNSCKYEK